MTCIASRKQARIYLQHAIIPTQGMGKQKNLARKHILVCNFNLFS